MVKRSMVHWTKGRVCVSCGASDNLTRHHIKNPVGKKTGRIKILCRKCHTIAEKDYELRGIVTLQNRIKLSHNEKLQLDYMSGLIPYYSINGRKLFES